jgi:hypothetical protein
MNMIKMGACLEGGQRVCTFSDGMMLSHVVVGFSLGGFLTVYLMSASCVWPLFFTFVTLCFLHTTACV